MPASPPTAPALPANLPSSPGWGLLLMLGVLIAFAPLSIDMYLPGLPDMARDFGVSPAAAQSSLAAYLIGMALGQSLYGPLADRFGRKPPLYFGLALYTVASLGCVIASDMTSLVIWRLVQALGGCATVVIPMAMVVDRFDQAGTARALSRLMLVMGVAPIAAPVLGSFVVAQWGWRAIFVLLAVAGFAALMAACLLLQESLPAARRTRASVGESLRDYGRLMMQRDFMGFALTGGFVGAGLFSYIAGSSFIFIDLYQLSAQQYGAVFGANALGLIAASQVNHALLSRWTAQQVLRIALPTLAALGVLTWALPQWAATRGLLPGSGAAALLVLLVPLFGYLVMFGCISPNTSAAAMAARRGGGGSASALLGTLQFALGALSGVVVGLLDDGTSRGMTGTMALCGVAAWLCWRCWPSAQARR